VSAKFSLYFKAANLAGLLVVFGLWLAAPALAAEDVLVPVSKDGPVLVAAADGDEEVNDPLESVNRAIFGFNEVIYEGVLWPVADFYNDNLPATMRLGVSNFLTNLSSPITLVNNLLQGNLMAALETLGRLFVNTTVGMGGIVDVIGEEDGPLREEDFGQTLGVWGMGEGLYLVLPIFGPSNPRDVVGKFLVDPYFDAVGNWIDNTDRDELGYARSALGGVDEVSGVVDELRQIKKTSVDYYAALRSLYRQKRKAEISNGQSLDLPPIPNLGYDLSPEDFEQPSLAGTGAKQSAAK